ncbi:MSMEG_1061 family FMN-dependent PPOX-type flavoprotein [Actinacidiphila sp. DG2A-62]|uniref:MSMEG_1061 family FMN-dependent PPOX-type flavoprotein n=1 Tax=Actinacidiphila sp. DG2A-62 TaxID=3108821 RepID=UPI002DB8B3C8|nr:MSMEG_1061 family FMN-dependent PPOX-type flavoprotein [Actinacidiphila sp. DG2A-62]MEC3997100.1 MSMEG_1061 family FMN-dependent PPOX-type flavoprotein [Actinacidiphila sp. DG2A-62]
MITHEDHETSGRAAPRARPSRISYAEVRARIGEPDDMIKRKVHDRLDHHCRRFIAHSPFLTMATANAAGLPDSSPRGDYPGFVKVLDERTLAIPDRPGNNLADSFRNLAENDGIGLMFIVPGMREVLRINGRAYPTDEADVLARMQTEGKSALLAIIVDVEEVFFHCGRALIRSRLWDPAAQALADELPSMGEIARDQMSVDADPSALDSMLEDDYRHLY